MNEAFEVEGLVKQFGKTTALAGVNLNAREGPVLGVLGPNGAGKTTVLRILATLLRPDEGRATVGGLDVVRDGAGDRSRPCNRSRHPCRVEAARRWPARRRPPQ